MRVLATLVLAAVLSAGCSQHAPVTPAQPALAQAEITKRLENSAWRFSRADGAVIAARIVLRPGGQIEGLCQPNEAGWAVQDGYLVFVDAAGAWVTRFDRMGVDKMNDELLFGAFKPDAKAVHVLTRLPDEAGREPVFLSKPEACAAPLPQPGHVRIFAETKPARVLFRLAADAADKPAREADIGPMLSMELPQSEWVSVTPKPVSGVKVLFDDGQFAATGSGVTIDSTARRQPREKVCD